jgi:hypothetical protein
MLGNKLTREGVNYNLVEAQSQLLNLLLCDTCRVNERVFYAALSQVLPTQSRQALLWRAVGIYAGLLGARGRPTRTCNFSPCRLEKRTCTCTRYVLNLAVST